MKRLSPLLLVMAIFCSVDATAATEQEMLVDAEKLGLRDNSYMAGWFINPEPIADPAMPIKKYQPILATKMFPWRAYALEGPLAAKSHNYTAPTGTELVGVIAHVPIACTLKNVGQTALQKVTLRSGSVHLCFVDTNKDGSFDVSFATKAGIWSGSIPETAQPMESVKYRSVDAKSSTLVSNLRLYLLRAKKNAIWIGYLQDEKDRSKDGLIVPLAGEEIFYEIKGKSLPLKTSLFGTEYQIDEIGNSTAKFSILNQKKIAPVYIGTTCCR